VAEHNIKLSYGEARSDEVGKPERGTREEQRAAATSSFPTASRGATSSADRARVKLTTPGQSAVQIFEAGTQRRAHRRASQQRSRRREATQRREQSSGQC
jgi:hypothetical protein